MTDSMYREIILDHYRNPHHHGRLDPADVSHEETNPLCGDEIRVDVRIKDGVIFEIAFDGRGCAVSQASASILTDMVEGLSVQDAIALRREDLLDELGIPVSPARMKCATLGLKALKLGLTGAISIDDDKL